ncbi:serine/threonine protein kinase [Pullulanibacillus sp. KACC 23026]|uniref:serine/threonine protein kinase n=1 Tax=Pullulanibacillus sp. KACC 23026 TaxID=3028315 RepID=UPI0023B1ABEC|nr:serine/threonine protein kinase [Pullulanibacillus sp. KACC 23026]WEG12143.1 serine/threonine protein kinase [Pullulanibacillus sp. KACC 23026]
MAEAVNKMKVNDVSFSLKEPHSFDWLMDLGKVFTVFDQQDSGNLSFGVMIKGQKKFVKYAGASTIHYSGDPQDAIDKLKASRHLYHALEHPALIQFEYGLELPNGYAMVFDWFEGEGLHNHWRYPPPLKETDPDSPFRRFRERPIHKRLSAFQQVLAFHVEVEKRGFVAVDFYDGSLLYNFQADQLRICDIDEYRKKPFINDMGRLWGSTRFMSPEEFTLGASIDSRTNVFNMGALAFVLLGGGLDRSYSKWEAGPRLFDIARKAVEEDPGMRYPSVDELTAVWVEASTE